MWFQIWLGILGTFSTKGTYWNIINNKQRDYFVQTAVRKGTGNPLKGRALKSGVNCSKTTLVQMSNCWVYNYKSWNTIPWSVHAAMSNSSSENNIASLPSSSVFNSAQTLSNKIHLFQTVLRHSVAHYHQTSNLMFQRVFFGHVCLF